MRSGGAVNGELVGVLGIHFDWEPQAKTVVEGVRIDKGDKASTRVLLTDANGRIIAASDGRGVLEEHFRIRTEGRTSGHYIDASGQMVAFHRTPGYETYDGLGWYGVIAQKAG